MRKHVLPRPIVFIRVRRSILILLIKAVRCSIHYCLQLPPRPHWVVNGRSVSDCIEATAKTSLLFDISYFNACYNKINLYLPFWCELIQFSLPYGVSSSLYVIDSWSLQYFCDKYERFFMHRWRWWRQWLFRNYSTDLYVRRRPAVPHFVFIHSHFLPKYFG
jgi:hypothetical protein